MDISTILRKYLLGQQLHQQHQ
ncbi:hypothetical protein CY0110_15557 [Crocosphaera chwakensis CCY0110]|uniref:Uncharacterized protein n=1 Tax=Crocosphaera chwakensis CCY0110 TaxID=391612 RepID=A3IHE3_9CHRO|nr:hypothetical protein CY0110_15557 [Crocosphaera chwakensis CCY0110]